MAFHRNTVIAVSLSIVSLTLDGLQFYLQTPYPLRIAASALAVLAYFASFFDLRKFSSNFQLFSLFLSIITLGISTDQRFPAFPFITLAMFLSFLSFRKFFRKWFSESTMYWMDPLMIAASFGAYAFGNLVNEPGWAGWVFPVFPLVFNAYLAFMDFFFTLTSLKFVSGKKRSVETGKPAPSFSLPDKDGKIFRLDDFRDKRHVLIVFIRNDWCPSCRIKLRTYDRHRHLFNEKNIQILAISPAGRMDNDIHASLGIQMSILYDEGQDVCRNYGVQLPVEIVGKDNAPGMPLPASFLIDKKGIVRYTSRPDRIGEFLDPATIFPVLESLN